MAINNELHSHSASTENVPHLNLAQATTIPMTETLGQAVKTTHSAVDRGGSHCMETHIEETPLTLPNPEPGAAQASSSSERRMDLDESPSARHLATRSADGGILSNHIWMDLPQNRQYM